MAKRQILLEDGNWFYIDEATLIANKSLLFFQYYELYKTRKRALIFSYKDSALPQYGLSTTITKYRIATEEDLALLAKEIEATNNFAQADKEV